MCQNTLYMYQENQMHHLLYTFLPLDVSRYVAVHPRVGDGVISVWAVPERQEAARTQYILVSDVEGT